MRRERVCEEGERKRVGRVERVRGESEGERV